MKKFSLVATLTLSLILIGSCGKEEPTPPPSFINADVNSITFPASGASENVTVYASGEWTAKVEGAGFSISPASGNGNGTVSVTAARNSSESQVTGTLTLTNSQGQTATVSLVLSPKGTLEKAQDILDDFYEKLGGANLKIPWVKGKQYPGLTYNTSTDKITLRFDGVGLKGEIPESIGDLGGMISHFYLNDESGVSGKLPDSFRKLVNLEEMFIQKSSMTSLPDVFGDMTHMRDFVVTNNPMTGQLPESLNCPGIERIYVVYNEFTGTVPASWGKYCDKLFIFSNCLSGDLSGLFANVADNSQIEAFFNNNNLVQKKGYGFDLSNVEIPGGYCWPRGEVEDLDGETFTFKDVLKKNKYTIYLHWAPWCPSSKQLLPRLKKYYDTYRQDGLEIIATVMANSDGSLWHDVDWQKSEAAEKGYDEWYNFDYWSSDNGSTEHELIYLLHTPSAEVYDSEGNILFSSFRSYSDPVRDRFGKAALTDLIPFLETLFGPEDVSEPYTSVDYSQDGHVTTLQTATVGNGINVVFLGDAYTDKDMGSGGLYETVMSQAMEEFFAIEPYKTFRDRFNVYSVKVVSPNGRIGEGNTTALATTFGTGTRVTGDYEKCFQYALKVPEITSAENLLVCVMINSVRASGTNSMFESLQSSVAFSSTIGNDPELFGPTLRHEANGHGFGFLADEYYRYNDPIPAEEIETCKRVYDAYGWYSNIDFTNDPSKIRWSDFLSDSRYKNEVGVFEGGALYKQGAWRPSDDSVMRNNIDVFNAPSRLAIYKRIMELSGEGYSFEKFLEYDAVNRSAVAQSPARPPFKAAFPEETIQHAPPIIFP